MWKHLTFFVLYNSIYFWTLQQAYTLKQILNKKKYKYTKNKHNTGRSKG